MWARLVNLLEMIRFSHTLFALPFALLAAVMAWTTPAGFTQQQSTGVQNAPPPFRWVELVGILVCMVSARSAAMAFNRVVDRPIDAANPRTSRRHLVTGALSVRSVAAFTVTSAVGFVAGTLLFLPNRLPLYLAVPVLGFVLAYSYTKRFTALSHFWLGAALMLAPVSAWIAIRGPIVIDQPHDLLPAVLLGLGVLLWVAGFDMIYACQDVGYDTEAKLHSAAVALGVSGALGLAAVCHAGMIVVLTALPWLFPQLGLGWVYGLAVAIVAGLLIYEHAVVRPDDLTRVNIAFFNVNAVVSIGLCVVATLDLLT